MASFHPIESQPSPTVPPTAPHTADVPAGWVQFLQTAAARLESSGHFGAITLRDTDLAVPRLAAAAQASAAPAAYRLEWADGRVWVSLVTADRWLSQSIEQDLVHTGDKLQDLLEEELADLADSCPAAAPSTVRPSFEHFRSEDLLFTFRSPLPGSLLDGPGLGSDRAVDTAVLWLMAYEATFRPLGDMEGGDDDE
jgi:hypothetical protein